MNTLNNAQSSLRRGTPLEMRFKASTILWLTTALLLLYLVWGTGIHSDDYPLIEHAGRMSLMDYLLPDPESISVLIFGPFSYYFDYFPYYVFGHDFLLGYDLLKWLSSLLSIGFIYRFASDYLPSDRALVAAIAFVLYPIHDATLYWALTLIYALTPGIIMFAHYLIRHEKYTAGVVVSTVGAFTSYASPPFTFGLGVIFLIERAYKKAFLFMAPGVFYLAYYFVVSHIPGLSQGRIKPDLTFGTFLKNYLLQLGSFVDTAVGPSFWLKLWYSVGEITLLSTAICIAAALLFFRWAMFTTSKVSRSLLIGLLAVVLLAFAMFALTGLYPQMAFNLGNRVAVYGSLPLAFGLAMLPVNKQTMTLLFAIFLCAVLGLSDHWKAWNLRQQEVINNIRTNAALAQLGQEDLLLVEGLTYSHLGPFGHIEFFIETYLARSVFNYALGAAPAWTIQPINRRYRVENGVLIDNKYGDRIDLGKNVFIYNAETNSLTRISIIDLPGHLAGLPKDTRHWLQLLKGNWLRSWVLFLMPRLEYVFE